MNMKSISDSDSSDPAARATVAGMKLGRRSRLVGLALLVVFAAIWQWDRLVALGIAPLILAIAPCLVMCSLGLCMQKLMGGKCSKTQQVPTEPAPTGALKEALQVNSTKQE